MRNTSWLWAGLVSNILFALAFAPTQLSLVVFVALAPWLAQLQRSTTKQSLASGFLFGAVLYLVQMYWLIPFVSRWTGSALLASIPWLLVAILAGLHYSVLGMVLAKLLRGKAWWLVPLVWAGFEAYRAYMPMLAFPWANLANPLWPMPQVIQHASLGTIYLVSAWVMLSNVVVSRVVLADKEDRMPIRAISASMTIFGLFLGYSLVRYAEVPKGEAMRVTIGQHGVDMAFTPEESRPALLAQAAETLSSRAIAQGSDFLVLPEGSAPSRQDGRPAFWVENPGIPVLYGAFRYQGNDTYQSAYALEEGRWTVADKTRIVVFGEYVPFREILPLGAFNLPDSDLTAATELKTVRIGGIPVGALICFEALFPDLGVRHQELGARLFAVMSIDDFFQALSAPEQLMSATVWRSVEAGLPSVRAASTGYSVATDARGRVLTVAPRHKLSAIRVDLTVPERGDGFPARMLFIYATWGILVGCLVWALIPAKLLDSKRIPGMRKTASR